MRLARQRKGKLMKLNLNGTLGLAIAGCLALATSAFAAGHGASAGAGSSMGASHGNSSFGMGQRTDLQTGSDNSTFGRTTAANARMKSNDADDQDKDEDDVKTKKTKTARHHTFTSNPGNSAFGRNQRTNHLKGSGNNAHGKSVSANAKLKHTTKTNQ
jgi:hypothetical protein